MKITILAPALVAYLGLALAGAPATAQDQTSTNTTTATAPATTPAPKKTKSASTQYKGSITAIDATSVTVANTKKTLTLAITAKTKFKKGKEVATLADFAVGDAVTGSYSTDATGTMTANSLHKKTPKAAATPAAAPATTAAPAAPATQ